MTNVSYTLTDTTITAVIGFVPRVIPKSHPNFDAVREALLNGTTEAALLPLLDIPTAIKEFSDGDVEVVSGRLFFKGFEVKNSLARLILQLIKEGKEKAAAPFKAFMAKAFANPDPRAALDLYEWVVHSGLPITPDGDILAWKAVNGDYTSIYGGSRGKQFDHNIGKTVEQDRKECDANPDKTCSAGLHFCSGPYLKSYARGGSRIVAVKISPTDVVAFPKDYGWEKGRACKYQVVGEVPLDQVQGFYPSASRIHTTGYEASKPAVNQASDCGDGSANAEIVATNNGKFSLRNISDKGVIGVYSRQRDAVRKAKDLGLILA